MSEEFFYALRIGTLEGENKRLKSRLDDALVRCEQLRDERRELKRKLRVAMTGLAAVREIERLKERKP